MKRAAVCILILLLVLSGCNTNPSQETTQGTETPNTAIETEPPVTLYQPDSALEQLTDGALRSYVPQSGEIIGFTFLDEDVILFSGTETGTEITRLDGYSGAVKATTELTVLVDPYAGSVVTGENRITYYDSANNVFVVMDGSFREVDMVDMPEGCTGVPLLTRDMKTAYCTIGKEIRAVDMVTGIPRLVAQTNAQSLVLHQLLELDTILCCHVMDVHGVEYKAFISGEDGRTLGTDSNLLSLVSWGECYLARRQDGPYRESLLNTGDGVLLDAIPEEEFHTLVPLPTANALAGIAVLDAQVQLSLYDMEKGCCMGRLTLESEKLIWPKASEDGSCVWFVTEDPTGSDILCRWDYSNAQQKDNTVRIGKRYTREAPDTQGLAACRELAEMISEKYAVEILLHDQMVVAEGYEFTEEYQVPAIRRVLEALDNAMANFPEGFFKTAAKVSNNRKITISLIRDFEATERNAPVDLHGLTYWIGGSVYLALPVRETTERDFYHELSHALDTYVYSKSIHYDFWNDCNPEGFAYFENYADYLLVGDDLWLQPETRAFLDAYSMTFAYEDRATVLEYALTDGNGEFFETEIMQAKLNQLCKGIRQAFGWRKYEGTFIWEQYLQESLAYVNKK